MKKLLPLLFCLLIPGAVHSQNGEPNENQLKINRVEQIVKKNRTTSNEAWELVEFLDNPKSSILLRERAAWAIGELELKKRTPALLRAVKHKSVLIRSAALDSLIRLRTPGAFNAFLRISKSDPVLLMRQKATIGMGLLRLEKGIQPLVNLSSDESPEIRGAATLSMAALHSKKNDFREILKEMAADKDLYVQIRADRGLEVAERKNGVVKAHLTSTDSDIRLFGAFFMHHHGKSSDLPSLKTALKKESARDVKHEMKIAINAIEKRRAVQQSVKQTNTQPTKAN